MDVMSARNMAEATVKALQVCRNDQRFHTIWQIAEIKSNTIKNVANKRYQILDQGGNFAKISPAIEMLSSSS